MALDVYFKENLYAQELASIILAITVAQAHENPNAAFVQGLIAKTRHNIQALGYSWPDFVAEAQRSLGTECVAFLPE